MRSLSRIAPARTQLAEQRRQGKRIGLVPTMGNIHAGHLALLEQCRHECDFSVATIFVNPLQFGPAEDFADYPRTFERDRGLLAAHGCDLLLHPSVREVYGKHPEASTRVHVPVLSERFCGASRPGHFDGVATVVTRLLNFVEPDIAFLGLKDYQQYLIICKLVADLGMNIRIAGVETVRETDGLAMSSRNACLTPAERAAAPALYRVLRDMARQISAGGRDYPGIATSGRKELIEAGLEPDYLGICNAHSLQAPGAGDLEIVILAAARLGRTRLIDNLRLAIEPVTEA